MTTKYRDRKTFRLDAEAQRELVELCVYFDEDSSKVLRRALRLLYLETADERAKVAIENA
jgi:hypothetical protein